MSNVHELERRFPDSNGYSLRARQGDRDKVKGIYIGWWRNDRPAHMELFLELNDASAQLRQLAAFVDELAMHLPPASASPPAS